MVKYSPLGIVMALCVVILRVVPEPVFPITNAFAFESPPVIISEFIADNHGGLEVEWVELKNRSSASIDFDGWSLGDRIRLYPIIDREYELLPGQYVVLCKDSSALVDYYEPALFDIIEMTSWAALNNDGDLVRLVDDRGDTVDSFEYEDTFGDNVSWARMETDNGPGQWGRSQNSGGTPGRPNMVYLEPTAERVRLNIEPNPFSLRHDEAVRITFAVPPGESLSMIIYDIRGREVVTLIDNAAPYEGAVCWDGRFADGRPVPIGIYVIYFEIAGVERCQRTVVVGP